LGHVDVVRGVVWMYRLGGLFGTVISSCVMDVASDGNAPGSENSVTELV
jgi:hypothetical protein